MKNFLIALSLVFCTQLSAQQALNNDLPLRFFNEGKRMFIDKNYVGSEHSLKEFKKLSTDRQLITEADYMLVSSLYFRGNNEAGILLKEYLDQHPETYHRDQICFYIGSSHFSKKEWEKSLFWLKQADVNYLPVNEQEDHSYRLAYASLQNKNRAEAKRMFGLLNLHSEKYKDPSAYYLAYIDFNEGNYDKSLATFDGLRNKPEYKEEASFFIIQGHFLKKDLRTAVSEGENYIGTYPRSKNTAEAYRILGNSYNRLNDVNSSISNYEKYLELESNPISEDMYLLGTSYYQAGNYSKAINALKHTASTQDKQGQAAYMLLGQSYLKMNDNANALMCFDAASRSNFDTSISEAALYNYTLLVHQTSLSVFDQSVTALQRFLKEYPESKYADHVNDILASTFLSTKNYAAALSAINEMKSPGKAILEAKQAIYFRLGTQDFINKQYDDANRNFEASINMGNYDSKAKNESQFWLGEIAYRKGNYSRAAVCYQTYVSGASASDANYGLALYNLGYAYFQQKQYATALPHFQKYVAQEKKQQSPNYSDALNRIGDCSLYNRNYADAEKYYSRAIVANPSEADYAEFQKAFVMGLSKDYAGKISVLNSMMSKYPTSQYFDDALYEKSRALVMLGRDAEAITSLEQLIREYPQSPINQHAGVQLGQLYFNTNNSPRAIEAYKHVISNFPQSEEAAISIKSLETVYKDLNDIDSYASYVNTLGTGVIITSSRQDSLSFLAAESIYMKGQKSNAKTAFRNYIQTYPNGAYASDAHYLLGYMAFEDKNNDDALASFQQVIKSNNRKHMDDALIYSSGILFDKKAYDEAYATYAQLNNTATSSESKNVAQLGMLRSAFLTHKNSEVVAAAKALIDNTKTSPDVANEARYYRAKAHVNLKQTNEAISDLEILSKDSRNVFGAESQYILAQLDYNTKSYDKAIKQVQAFMKQGTPHEYWMAKSLIVLSDCYAAQGDSFQAKQYLESLKANYKGTESDIAEAVDKRLNN